ncbi:MAG: hypothetical protein JXN59_06450, partial [Anaerolineae bacterium]|nr:hypothetical protein [Anaerolineae bacterium]
MKSALRLLMVMMLAGLVLLGAARPAAAQKTTVQLTMQRFEHGLMIWRADTGMIWALFDTGAVRVFPHQVYSGLPEPRPAAPPAGRASPIFGFGKVWGSYGDVRARLGWAMQPETGFTAAVTRAGDFLTYIRDPNGRLIQLYGRQAWAYAASPAPAPAPDITFDATFQQFENGFMIWRSDTGDVLVFWGQDGGQWLPVPISDYDMLPDTPPVAIPPGRFQPGMGFGKVWGGYG